MAKYRTIGIIFITILVFLTLKLLLNFPTVETELVKIILTISSILFGLLVGFFISELWSRYTEIRELQGIRSSEELNMIRYARYFFRNKKFEREFKKKMETAAVVDMSINWNEGHLEIPYFREIEKPFKMVKVANRMDSEYFGKLLNSYNSLIQAMVRMDTLYKERLFMSEWLIMSVLSIIISISILFLNATNIFSTIILIIFPTIIVLAMSIVYDLDRLVWGRGIVTISPIEKVFDAISLKRFYLKRDLKYVSPHIKDFRTEDSLKGELRKVYLDILNQRRKGKKR